MTFKSLTLALPHSSLCRWRQRGPQTTIRRSNVDQAPDYVPVEVGSGWYLRGDVGYAFSHPFKNGETLAGFTESSSLFDGSVGMGITSTITCARVEFRHPAGQTSSATISSHVRRLHHDNGDECRNRHHCQPNQRRCGGTLQRPNIASNKA